MDLNISLLCISVLQSHCQDFYVVGMYILTVAKRSKPLAFEQAMVAQRQRGNIKTLLKADCG